MSRLDCHRPAAYGSRSHTSYSPSFIWTPLGLSQSQHHCTGSWIVLLFLVTSSSQTKHTSYSSQSRLLILDPALVGQLQENSKDATIRIFSSTLSTCISLEHFTLPTQSLQLRDSRCNNIPPSAIKKGAATHSRANLRISYQSNPMATASCGCAYAS
jgi:hypothetical protein